MPDFGYNRARERKTGKPDQIWVLHQSIGTDRKISLASIDKTADFLGVALFENQLNFGVFGYELFDNFWQDVARLGVCRCDREDAGVAGVNVLLDGAQGINIGDHAFCDIEHELAGLGETE